MTPFRYLLRSLVFYRRTHWGVALGALLAAAILTGSLGVGDSVRFSLRRLALERLGAVDAALVSPGGGFFRERLAGEIAARTGGDAAPVLLLRGTVARPDGSALCLDVQVVGVDARFWRLWGGPDLLAGAPAGSAVVNASLAERLGGNPGDPFVVRVEEPSLLSRDAPLSGAAGGSVALRLRAHAVADAARGGVFRLRATPAPPLTVFLPLETLQKETRQPGRANGLLAAGDADAVNTALRGAWQLADLSLNVRPLAAREGDDARSELYSQRVFLDPAIAEAARQAVPGARGALTYLANEIRLGEKAAPYSLVTAAEAGGGMPPLGEGEIALNAWLAEDLGAKPGDSVALQYYKIGEDRRLEEKTSRFTVRAVLPMERLDASWMPPFPGLADVENCRDWEPGIPMDLGRIRPKDEAYWKTYRGVPKAFVGLRAGQAIWGNRFGALTSLRFPAEAGFVEKALRERIDPVRAGLSFQPVRAEALRAGEGAQDFGGLFLGFSFFLIAAALLLMAMLFVLSREARAEETGILLALGFESRRLRRWALAEGGASAALGALAGAAAGAGYARLALRGLATIWRGAAPYGEFRYHAEPLTLALGAGAGFAVAMLALALAGRGEVRRPATELLARGAERETPLSPRAGRWNIWGGALALAAAVAVLCGGGRSAEAFFGAGALLLAAGIAGSAALLARLARGAGTARSVGAIGVRGAARRPGRSLTTVAVLASGVFLTIATGAFRQDPLSHAQERDSGTGGFAWFARTTLPVYEAPPEADGVALRVREGDDASCLNLNRAQTPGFFGVRPEALARRGAFRFQSAAPGLDRKEGWKLLAAPQPGGAVPAIGDEATVRWGLGLEAGAVFSCPDGRGGAFPVRIVGVLPASVLEGSLVIAESEFVRRFPAEAGWRAFLLEASVEHGAGLAWLESVRGRGMERVAAARRLADFLAVENSYLGIFQALGGLGLLLGSAGLAVVVWRNVSERRGEFALLQALGFGPGALRRLVLWEHAVLVGLGVGIGTLAAAVAILPSLAAAGNGIPWAGPLATALVLAGCALAWSWLAARLALRGPLLEALRGE
ncbi:MAG: hypothetical protein PHQ12_04225 [Chthoniobacteraceae bacterium]|nr:hypothetical protein [Chthoniobacteraceae bacterium]